MRTPTGLLIGAGAAVAALAPVVVWLVEDRAEREANTEFWRQVAGWAQRRERYAPGSPERLRLQGSPPIPARPGLSLVRVTDGALDALDRFRFGLRERRHVAA